MSTPLSQTEFAAKLRGSGPDSPEETEIKARFAFALLENDGPVIGYVKALIERVNKLEEDHANLVAATHKTFVLIDEKFDAFETRHELNVELFQLAGKRLDEVEEDVNQLSEEDGTDILSRLEKLEDEVDELTESPVAEVASN